jgi:hypothetical protein
MVRNLAAKAEVLIIVLLACIPLFIHFPYRVNIFLSWEGAYRISKGQLPFRDFGTPLGGMYWVIPAIFFKLLGPKLITLIKAQVFINILSGLAFRSILSNLGVNKGVRLVSIFLFCISYSFFNFWPWYNHSVIVYELVALAFLVKYIAGSTATTAVSGAAMRKGGMTRDDGTAKRGRDGRYSELLLVASALFIVCSFLTKQDGGGMAFLIGGALLACDCLVEKKWMPLVWYGGAFAAILGIVVLIFGRYGFGYWFNHGQPPHSARVSPYDIADEFFGASQWIKFYFFLTVVLLIARLRAAGPSPTRFVWADIRSLSAVDKRDWLLVILTWAILGEAAIFQVTSYTPPDNNIFFHAFAFAGIFSLLAPLLPVDLGKPRIVMVMMAGMLLWWSGTYWKYMQRIVARVLPSREEAKSATGENVINKYTYMISQDTTREIPMEKWVECGLPAFDKIYMPPPTADGIHRLMGMEMVKIGRPPLWGRDSADLAKNLHPGPLRVLNMSELTPLAVEIPYEPESNPALPLWYHLGVGMFNRQAAIFESRISDHYYDLVLFEYIPTLNNFNPFRVRDSLMVHYQLVDSFPAPRRGDTRGTIEVYTRPSTNPYDGR